MTNRVSPHRPLLTVLSWDVGLPLLAYYGLRLTGLSEQLALSAGAMFALTRIALVATRKRSFDGFAALLATVLIVGLILSLFTGNERFLALKESFATAAAALILLTSCATRAPMVLVAVRAGANEHKRAEIDRLLTEVPHFWPAFVRMTAVWGIGLLLEAALRIPLVYLLPVDVMIGLSIVLLLTVIGLLSVWTVSYATRVHTAHTTTTADGRHAGADAEEERVGSQNTASAKDSAKIKH